MILKAVHVEEVQYGDGLAEIFSIIGPDVPPWTRLVDFIREVVQAPGTKALCREGGCGVCTVVATVPDRESPGHTKTFSVQAVSGGGGQCITYRFNTNI
ncbi:hypothetical protein E2C01_094954 [Portunus trituberculatus]|uniref:2Fe-2S ferredoxin-type domain-containing protein n=1 Tax=Portunus trituberculatus TaxID=210409 RepID=A0A5B7K4I2_PORTR|nr:hypothetical protein [Portunus trituberculatus]